MDILRSPPVVPLIHLFIFFFFYFVVVVCVPAVGQKKAKSEYSRPKAHLKPSVILPWLFILWGSLTCWWFFKKLPSYIFFWLRRFLLLTTPFRLGRLFFLSQESQHNCARIPNFFFLFHTFKKKTFFFFSFNPSHLEGQKIPRRGGVCDRDTTRGENFHPLIRTRFSLFSAASGCKFNNEQSGYRQLSEFISPLAK